MVFRNKFNYSVHTLTLLSVQSGSRLFGFIGAGATLGQLFGSLFATGMAWMGPCMHVFLVYLEFRNTYILFSFYFVVYLFLGKFHAALLMLLKRKRSAAGHHLLGPS